MLTAKLDEFFNNFSNLSPEEVQNLVEEHLNDDAIEVMIEHLEDFYGIEDDEELGSLCQIMVTGYLAALATSKTN